MEAPQDYKTAGIFMLVAGITTTLGTLVWVLFLIWVQAICDHLNALCRDPCGQCPSKNRK